MPHGNVWSVLYPCFLWDIGSVLVSPHGAQAGMMHGAGKRRITTYWTEADVVALTRRSR